MKINVEQYAFYLRPGYTDMRKGATKLAYVVQNEMGLRPFEKSVFIFCGRSKRVLKAIVWDGNGWYEIIKRLESGKSFCYPTTEELAKAVTIEQVLGMLKGQDVWREIPKFYPTFVG